VETPFSESIQDYLRVIYKLEADGGRATTSAIAERMGVAAPSVTGMVKKLTGLGLVEHERYRGAVLTATGRRAAIEITRHHRLLEQYLVENLGLGIEAVHAEADRLEHALSEEVEARIDEELGFPTHDPHGDPIPDASLHVERFNLRTLASLEPGEVATIRRVPDDDAELLAYLSRLELVPGCRVEVRESAPLSGPVTVAVGREQHALPRRVAALIGVV
jgi:DtxR family transcriptional regulator, Mn-dependent transcriptional regulator